MDTDSRPASLYSQSPSTRHLIPHNSSEYPPFSPAFLDRDNMSNLSLTVNYLPSKFSSSMLDPQGPRRRKGKASEFGELGIPKQGGGVEAFRSGANRIPGREDEDEWTSNSKRRRKMKWTKFKWILFFSNILVGLFLFVKGKP